MRVLSLLEDTLSMPVVSLMAAVIFGRGSLSQKSLVRGKERGCLSTYAHAGVTPWRLPAITEDVRSRKLRSLRLPLKPVLEAGQRRH